MKGIIGICLSMTLLLFSACKDSGEYVNALPRDAAVVISADLQRMSEKAELNGEAGKAAVERVGAALKSGLEGSDELINKIIKDPSESGLDLTEKVYFFAEPQMGTVGVLACVSSEKKIDRLLETLHQQQVCDEVRKSEGCRWTAVGNALVAYTDAAFLVMKDPKSGNAKDLVHQAAMLLRQKKEESYATTKDFEGLHAAQSDMACVYSLKMMPQNYLSLMTMGLSADLKPQDIKWLVSINFETGRAVMDVKNITTDKIMNNLIDKQLKASAPIDGKYLDTLPAATPMWLMWNMKGGVVYDLLCENPTFKQQMENPMMPIDVRAIFRAIDGDVCVAVTDFANFSFAAYADVNNSDFLQTFEKLKPLLEMTGGRMQLLNRGPEAYELHITDPSVLGTTSTTNFWFGVRDRHFYFTNREELIHPYVPQLTLRDTEVSKHVAHKRWFGTLKFDALQPLLSQMGEVENVAPLLTVLGGMDYMTIETADGKNGQWVWVMKDRKTNVLKQIVQGLGN